MPTRSMQTAPSSPSITPSYQAAAQFAHASRRTLAAVMPGLFRIRLASSSADTPTSRAHAAIGTSDDRNRRLNDRLTRACDVVGAALALLLAAPLMALIALAVLITSPGPVLFAHRRMGRAAQSFPCLKFRTMVIDADAQLHALLERDAGARAEWLTSHKLRRDPRVTSIGRFLRRTSLDELPQLFNVLIGHMSLVGPRPIVAAEVSRYGRHFALYCQVRPGVTGLWQVQRCADTSYRRRVAFDVAYARTRSLRLYLVILARTVPAVLTGRGAW